MSAEWCELSTEDGESTAASSAMDEEQAHECLEQTQWQPECPACFLLLVPQSCVVQGCHHGLPHPLAQ